MRQRLEDALSKRLDHEAVNREEKANRQGREFVEPEILTQKQRDQLLEGKERQRKADARRDADHKRSLVANLGPRTLAEAAAQLRGLKGMIAETPSTEKTRRLSLEKQARELEAFIRDRGRKKQL